MADHSVGSIYSVQGLDDALAVVLAGPFAASLDQAEYLVAPIYRDGERGHRWTAEDVLLNSHETHLEGRAFAAIWNARPILAVDLTLEVSHLATEVFEFIRDAYWASLNEQAVGEHPRFGAPIRSSDEEAAIFQENELRRWEQLSSKVLVESETEFFASTTINAGQGWVIPVDEMDALGEQIEVSDALIDVTYFGAVGPSTVIFSAPMSFQIPPHTGGAQRGLFYSSSRDVFVGLSTSMVFSALSTTGEHMTVTTNDPVTGVIPTMAMADAA